MSPPVAIPLGTACARAAGEPARGTIPWAMRFDRDSHGTPALSETAAQRQVRATAHRYPGMQRGQR